MGEGFEPLDGWYPSPSMALWSLHLALSRKGRGHSNDRCGSRVQCRWQSLPRSDAVRVRGGRSGSVGAPALSSSVPCPLQPNDRAALTEDAERVTRERDLVLELCNSA